MHRSTHYMHRRRDNGWRPLRLPSEPLAEYLRNLDQFDWEIARRVGVTPTTIRHIRNGRHPLMNPDTIDKYCTALDIPMSHLYPGDNDD
jgi:DNA-binding Xre family transcriptional regulator